MENRDLKIKEKIDSKLAKYKIFNLSNIKTSVVDGIVTLEGNINAFWEKVRAETIIRTVKGVQGVRNKLSVIKEAFSPENLTYVTDTYLTKLECYFGLIGVIINLIIIFIAAIMTPGYNPFFDTVSSLGEGSARTLFSIGFVIGGALGIPFILYMEKSLRGINDFIRRIATAVAITTSLCIALVGILPDPGNPEGFLIFHAIVAFTAFIGSVIYICLYSSLMIRSGHYTLFHVVVGFSTGVLFIILIITQLNPLVEWILTINIQVWTILIVFNLLFK